MIPLQVSGAPYTPSASGDSAGLSNGPTKGLTNSKTRALATGPSSQLSVATQTPQASQAAVRSQASGNAQLTSLPETAGHTPSGFASLLEQFVHDFPAQQAGPVSRPPQNTSTEANFAGQQSGAAQPTGQLHPAAESEAASEPALPDSASGLPQLEAAVPPALPPVTATSASPPARSKTNATGLKTLPKTENSPAAAVPSEMPVPVPGLLPGATISRKDSDKGPKDSPIGMKISSGPSLAAPSSSSRSSSFIDPGQKSETPEAPSRVDLSPPAVLQVNIKFGEGNTSPSEESTSARENELPPHALDSAEKRPVQSAPAIGPASAPPAAPNSAPTNATPLQPVPVLPGWSPSAPSGSAVTPAMPPALVTAAPEPQTVGGLHAPFSSPNQSASTPAAPVVLAEPEPSRTPTPLRSVALEFTPDGTQDIRVRLSERAGEVHVSLHTSDTSLTGRLSEGVHELTSSLLNAGYEARVWTPDPNAQRQRNPQEQPQSREERAPDEESGGFDDFLQQNPEEGS